MMSSTSTTNTTSSCCWSQRLLLIMRVCSMIVFLSSRSANAFAPQAIATTTTTSRATSWMGTHISSGRQTTTKTTALFMRRRRYRKLNRSVQYSSTSAAELIDGSSSSDTNRIVSDIVPPLPLESDSDDDINDLQEIYLQNQAVVVQLAQQQQVGGEDRFRSEAYLLVQAAIVGMMTGAAVAGFKYSIEETRHMAYGLQFANTLLPCIPALGGLIVGLLALPGSFPPGLKGTIREIDKDARRMVSGSVVSLQRPSRHPFGFLRKTTASIATLGTGSSLGPEGPSVEVGMSMSRLCMNAFPPLEYLLPSQHERISNVDEDHVLQRNRLLLSCGAAAGVAAGFNAPIAGVFFALEIVEGAFCEVERTGGDPETKPGTLDITAILVASVLSALVFRSLLGNEMVLSISEYDLKTPLNELPLYMLLGSVCGGVSVIFSCFSKMAKDLFDGNLGPPTVRNLVQSLPHVSKPMIGGLLCGLMAIPYPQILFFGYETLNALLHSVMDDSLQMLLSLIFVKTIATALASASGLVGGTFAPSLFLGAMTGAGFHHVVNGILQFDLPGGLGTFNHYIGGIELADTPAYVIVGAASLLASLFRAPLTASLLLFELTHDYDVILPLMVSAGLGSVVADLIESIVEKEEVEELRRDRDSVSWGDLADKQDK